MNYLQQNIHWLSSSLSANGITRAVISPGSRNAPLTVALSRNPHIECYSIVDERSAGFVALGMAKQSGGPVILCCTSGTALLNYYPAIAEAFYAKVPLIILSADRPPELIDNWDGQSIRQPLVFDNHIQNSYVTPSYLDNENCEEEISDIVNSVCLDAIELTGPVHLNIPLREPLYLETPLDFEFNKAETPILSKEKKAIISLSQKYQKTLVLNGASHQENRKLESLLTQLNKQNKVVILNDIISNLSESTIQNFDGLLLNNASSSLKPDLLITTGKFHLSKSLKNFIRNNKPMKHVHLSEENGVIGDPFKTEPEVVLGVISENLSALSENLEVNQAYKSHWMDLDANYSKNFNEFLNNLEYGEFQVCHFLAKQIERSTVLHLANSTSVRYFSYLKDFLQSNAIQSNRGTSGIDGCTSTSVGYAMANPAKENILITGDIAFLYDVNALWNEAFPENLKIIVLNNAGGGIFRYIDGPNKLPELEKFFETGHSRTAENAAREFNISYLRANSKKELEESYLVFKEAKKPILLEVFTDKKINELQFQNFRKI